MCGIAGIWGREAPGNRVGAWTDDVRAMLATIRHRGPDGEGIVANRAGVLGAVRLAVIDPVHGAQPMSTADGRFAFALNGGGPWVVSPSSRRLAMRSRVASRSPTLSWEY